MSKSYAVAYQQRLVAEWQQSQQTKTAFARSRGIIPNTFWGWTRRYAVQADPPASKAEISVTGAAAPVFVDVTPVARDVDIVVRVGRPGHGLCVLDFDELPPPGWFASVLLEVAECSA